MELASIQSYYDVTREQIRELDMKIEKKEVEIENTEDENTTELRVFQQKANFIEYCHDKKLQDTTDDGDVRTANSTNDHEKQILHLQEVKATMRSDLKEMEEHNAKEIKAMQADMKQELFNLKASLDADIIAFEESSDRQHAELKHELETSRQCELDTIALRKEAHLKALIQAHETTLGKMKEYFDGIDSKQQIEIEDLEADIRRLKKAAIQHEALSQQLKVNNTDSGQELKVCSEQVETLEVKTKDKEKDAISLKNTNARLVATKKAVRDAKESFLRLQEMYAKVEDERNRLRGGLFDATKEACRVNAKKKAVLQSKLRGQKQTNSTIERHLHHILHSSGLDEEKSIALLSNVDTFLEEKSEDAEKLNLALANATKSYINVLKNCREELLRLGVPKEDIESIDVFGEIKGNTKQSVYVP